MRRAGAQPLLTALTALTSWVILGAWERLSELPGDLLGQVFIGIALIAATGALLRLASLSWLVVLSGQLLVALLVVHGFWGSGGLPTPTSVRAAVEAVASAVDSAGTYRAPVGDDVPTILPLLLVGALAVHLVVDLVAVTLGRVAVAGLPLLMAYTVPVSILGTPTAWPAFVIGGACFLGMLFADERGRLERWGRRIETGDRPRGGALIGAAALTAAVLVSAVLPSQPTLTLPGFGTGNSGPVRITDPIADLKRDLVLGADIPLLRVKVTSGPSTPAPSYVRLTVLDEFDGKSWRPGDHPRPQSQSATGEIPLLGLDPSQPGETIGWQVSVTERLASSWLPTPRHLRSIEAGSDWRYGADTLDFRAVDDVTTAGLSYPLTEFRPTLTADQLAAAGPAPDQIQDDYTRLPRAADSLRAVAERETRGASTDYDRGVALQRFFQSEFTYSTRIAPGNGLAALEHFLSPDGREGYCEQFAAAMAVLARELDIPARVSVGFLSGDRTTTDTYEFSSHDLHAWPELYIAGAGWVMFEPTPTSHTVAVPGYTRPTAQPSSGPSATATPSTVRPSISAGTKPRPETGSSGQDTSSELLTTWLPAVGVGAFALLLLGALPRALRRRRRARRMAAATPEEMWAELRDTAIDLGVPWPEERSPRATGLALAGTVNSVPEAPAALRRLVTTLETARYAPAGEQPPLDDQLAVDTETCLEALRDGASPAAQRRARWWPRSLHRRTTRSGAGVRQEHASGVVDQLDPPADA